jgi:hypothetical protein
MKKLLMGTTSKVLYTYILYRYGVLRTSHRFLFGLAQLVFGTVEKPVRSIILRPGGTEKDRLVRCR